MIFFFAVIVAVVLLTSCSVDQKKNDAQVKMDDSLTPENATQKAGYAVMQTELDREKNAPEKMLAIIRENYAAKEYPPEKLLAIIRENYAAKKYDTLKVNLDLLYRYHPDAKECVTAKGIYEQALRDQAEARKKAEAEAAKREAERRAKMTPIERIMEKYNCTKEIAELIHKRKVRIGMTTEQCRAAWGRPMRVNRDVGPWGVHEQWVYGSTYLYFKNGKMTSFQD